MDNIKFEIGNENLLAGLGRQSPRPPFSNEGIDFLSALSAAILKNGEAKKYSDLMTFAFWIRKANLLKMKENYPDLSSRLGKGVAFHSAPSNIPMNFAFSFAAGILAGNANIVRLPARDFPQASLAVSEIKKTLAKNKDFADSAVFVKYKTTKEAHDFFSALCDVRIVWGGDETIARFRQSPLKPRATEINFADRFSLAVIDSDFYLERNDAKRVAENFYNDTFYSDQNACTSPRIIFWLGKKIDEAKEIFWQNISALAGKRYSIQPVQATGKLAAFSLLASDKEGVKLTAPDFTKGANASDAKGDNKIFRISLPISFPGVFADIKNYAYHSGFFLECDIKSLDEILPMIDESVQTLSYVADKGDLENWIKKARPRGIDRIVPMGKTMDFSLVWDGVDLIYEMSRAIEGLA